MDISFEDKENLSQSANQANSTAGFLWMQSQLSELNLSLPKTMNDNPDKEILKCMEVLLQERARLTGCNLSINDETSDLRREVTSLERAADAQQNQIEAANQETASMNSRFLHLQAEHRKLKTQWQVEKTELENRVFQSLSLQQSTLGTLRKKEKDFDSLQSQLFTKLSREVPKGAKGAAIVVSKPLPREWSTGGKVRQNPTLRDAEIQALQSRLSLAEDENRSLLANMNERQNGCDESRRHETELEIETMKALFSQKSAEYEASLSTLEQNLQFHMNEKLALNSSNVAFQALANEKTKLALTLQNQLTEQLLTSQSLQKSLDLLLGQLEQNNSEVAAKCSDLEDKNLQLSLMEKSIAEAHSIEHSLRKEIALLSDDLSAARLQLNDAHFHNSRLQASINCLEDEKVDLKSRNSSLRALANEQTEAAQTQLAEQTTISRTLQGSLNLLQAQFKQQQSEFVAKCSDLEELNLQLSRMERRVAELCSIEDSLKRDLQMQTDAFSRVNSQLSEVEALNIRLQASAPMEYTEAKERVLQLELNLSSAESEKRKLRSVISDLRGNVRVNVRVRPFLSFDGPHGVSSIGVSCDHIVLLGKGDKGEDLHFPFDRTYGPTSSQEMLFNDVSEFVQSALDGYNVCLFSYGQTGSGKSFTMTGHGTEEMRGIIPRAMEQIGMYKLDLERRGWTYSMEVSYVEIYNENIRDLLRTTPNDDVKHEIRKDVNGNVTLSEVTMRVLDPNDSDAVNELIATAQTHRSTASTAMNEVSSRSHAVFSLQLRAHNESQGITLKGSLSLVDLAGSERLDRSGATGSRMKETIAINKSLSALVDVFAAIGNKQSHVPYRNSKLTYLLQPALSGDGKALMLVNLSPTTESIPESICSLRFASHVNRCELGKAKRQIVTESDTAVSMPSILPQSSQIKKVPRLR